LHPQKIAIQISSFEVFIRFSIEIAKFTFAKGVKKNPILNFKE